ncbi:MAG: GTPase Era [Hydrotalea sp.]|nr:GTPase Era [Hydrotalea sp.]
MIKDKNSNQEADKKTDSNSDKQFGVVALLGAPNAGKSTLANVLTGQKVSIVSRKPQTTRFRLTAIVESGGAQMALIDTPGIFNAKDSFDRQMVKAAWQALERVDCAVLLIAADSGLTPNVLHILSQLEKNKASVIAVLNKIDKVKKEQLLSLAEKIEKESSVERVLMISALKKDGTSDLLKLLVSRLPQGAWHYDSDQASDLPDRLFAAEILREQLFNYLHQELPYRLGVETESWKVEKNNKTNKTTLHIHQTIHIEKENHRPMILGRGGQNMKTIASRARQQMEELFEQKVFLKIFIRLTPDWREKHDATEFGFGL